MALLKFLRRSESSLDATAPSATSAAAEAVQAARQQARRRLVGAVVLLGVGIIGFPLVFQTQPRPIPVDIPIDIPRKDNAPPLAPVLMERSDAGRQQADAARSETAPPVAAAAASAVAVAAMPVEVEVVPPAPSASKPPAVAAVKADPKADVKADAKTETKAEAKDRGRFVVQAGAYTDAAAVREVRAKLERLGLKTYTQEVVVDGTTRVRVRVGPYATKQEAQEVQSKIKSAGVAASLLQL